jgi:hypothetical protein
MLYEVAMSAAKKPSPDNGYFCALRERLGAQRAALAVAHESSPAGVITLFAKSARTPSPRPLERQDRLVRDSPPIKLMICDRLQQPECSPG